VGQIPLVCIRGAHDYLESPNGLEERKVLILDKLAYFESCNEISTPESGDVGSRAVGIDKT
jgi:hypothetical protein